MKPIHPLITTENAHDLEKTGVPENEYALPKRIPGTPPVIAPVAAHLQRPQWSVMIPAYNCLRYLAETVESVLAQAPGPERMQIVVVDDSSTDGDVEALVRQVGGNRVGYFRQPQNVGSLRNFETCLNLSLGQWVHILHGDDRVKVGFYAEIENLFAANPEAGAAFTNWCHDDMVFDSGQLVSSSGPGIVKDFLVRNAQKLMVQPPAIVVKRLVYEQLGGFYAVHYGEDWEMWTRIAAHFPVAYSPKCLAYYRYMGNNSITQRSIANGQNVRDIIKVIDIVQEYIPAEHRKMVRKNARLEYAVYCAHLSYSLSKNDPKSALLQAKGALELSSNITVYKILLKYLIKYAIRPRNKVAEGA